MLPWKTLLANSDIPLVFIVDLFEKNTRQIEACISPKLQFDPSITDGVHRNENFEEIIPVFSTFSNFLKKNKKKYIKAIYVTFQCGF